MMDHKTKLRLCTDWKRLTRELELEGNKVNASRAVMGSLENSISKIEDRLSAEDIDPLETPTASEGE